YRNHVSVGLDKAALAALATERHADGLRLVDLERYVAGGKELWAGVWRAGGDANYYAIDRYPETFDELHAYRADTGLELTDLEVYDRACGDVFLLPFENVGKWRVSNGNWDEGGHGGKIDGLQAFAWDLINDTNG